jgi:hypothetical protein
MAHYREIVVDGKTYSWTTNGWTIKVKCPDGQHFNDTLDNFYLEHELEDMYSEEFGFEVTPSMVRDFIIDIENDKYKPPPTQAELSIVYDLKKKNPYERIEISFNNSTTIKSETGDPVEDWKKVVEHSVKKEDLKNITISKSAKHFVFDVPGWFIDYGDGEDIPMLREMKTSDLL